MSMTKVDSRKLLVVSASPHIRSGRTTSHIMLDVLIALLPACIAGIYIFGWYSAVMILFSAVVCVGLEYGYEKLIKKQPTVNDFSAAVTGVIFALTLPPATPLWVILVGDIVAIIIVKMLFGGIGQNFVNPAACARIICMVSFSEIMTTWAIPFVWKTADAATGATPLSIIREGGDIPEFMDMFLGNIGGCIGEVCKPAILIGFLYLVVRRVISIEIPLVYVGTVAVLAAILGKGTSLTGNIVEDLLAGGLLFGAVFMATDYTTSPMTRAGKVVFAVGCGLITVLIRYYTNYPGGVSFAIVIMNIITPLIDRHIVPKAFGGAGK